MKKEDKLNSRDYKFIIKFNKINLTEICKRLKINRSGIINGNSKMEDIIKVREELESEIFKIFIKEE